MKSTLITFIILILSTLTLFWLVLITEQFYRDITHLLSETSVQILNDNNPNDVIIELKYGRIRGIYKNESGLEFHQFLGIPYAKTPVNELRFRRPEPIERWSGIYEANHWPSFCMQINLQQYEYLTPVLTSNTSEDCLFMNIWTPKSSLEDSESLKPVIVYIHGGVFVYMGVGFDIFNAGVVASVGDVVFVTFNYRLGVFGFLDTGDEEDSDDNQDFPDKNVGIYDQIMALNFVKQNIENFGGDPDKITLMGQSAGAISIGLLMSSPLASPLFQRAILESSSPMQMKFFFEMSKTNYRRVLNLTGCMRVGPDRYKQIKCLRKLSEHELNAVHEVLMNSTFLSFSPSIPSLALPQFPREAFNYALADSDITQTEVLLGSNQFEGTLFLHQILPEMFPLEKLPDVNKTSLYRLLYEFSSDYHNLSATQIEHLLESTLGIDGETPEEIREQLSTLIGDFLFKCPIIKFAESLMDWPNVTVFMYYFTERSGLLPEWIGSSHFEEVQFVFGLPLRYPDQYSAKQLIFTERLIKTWTHFARTGQMLPQLGKNWPKYESESALHMELNSDRSSIGQRLEQNYYSVFEMAFETI